MCVDDGWDLGDLYGEGCNQDGNASGSPENWDEEIARFHEDMDDLYGDGERAGSIGSVGVGAGAAVSGAGVSGDDVGERGVGSSGVGHGSSSAFVGGEDGGEDVDEELVDPDTEQLVQEAMNRIPSRGEVLLELRQCEIDDNTLVHNFMTKTCSCTKWGGKACSLRFTEKYVMDTRLACKGLFKPQLDMFVMGQLVAFSFSSEATSTNKKMAHERKRCYTNYHHQGKPVCQDMFRVVNAIGSKHLRNLSSWLTDSGISPRVHGNTKRLPKHALKLRDVEYIVRFLLSYAEQHALLLPGRVPGYARDDIQLLPSCMSRRDVWKNYKRAAEEDPTIHVAAYTTFLRLWAKQLPQIVLMKPMTDLCWTCQQNIDSLKRSANCPEREKSDVVKKIEEHLRIVQTERSFYKTTCSDVKKEIVAHFTTDGVFTPPALDSQPPANSVAIRSHYSFDYAQQIHYPSDPMQPGPIYFLTPRKCAVFGVNCEAIPRQVNFLSDEAGGCGKGANTVVSQVDYFFSHHGLGEKEVFLHADNCTGQNKNNCMLQYLAWRVMVKKHTQITLSFLVVGHTKFSPDWCFGLFKRLYRRTRVGSLQAIAQVANSSAHCNFAQLNSTEDGTTIVKTCEWTGFLAPHFKKFAGIKKYHHFRFVSSEPGVVYARKQCDTAEEKFKLVIDSWSPDVAEEPEVITPRGLSAQRQWYLYEKIREFCPESDRDVTSTADCSKTIQQSRHPS